MQSCARCGFVVYPAEKINCIDQNWHKACFHCDVCKMVLTANNFVSHKKRPYCSVHNPRNNTFTSVYETPINITAKKQSNASSEVRCCHDGFRTQATIFAKNLEHDTEGAYSMLASGRCSVVARLNHKKQEFGGQVTSFFFFFF
uniref:LIM and SH3 domain protein 1 n=1 Tax=Hippocampus comes TaxID=109280 RepID=A0A3Q3DP78_HIPCM